MPAVAHSGAAGELHPRWWCVPSITIHKDALRGFYGALSKRLFYPDWELKRGRGLSPASLESYDSVPQPVPLPIPLRR